MMSLPVWLPGPFFFVGESLSLVPSGQRPPCTVNSFLLECILVLIIYIVLSDLGGVKHDVSQKVHFRRSLVDYAHQ